VDKLFLQSEKKFGKKLAGMEKKLYLCSRLDEQAEDEDP